MLSNSLNLKYFSFVFLCLLVSIIILLNHVLQTIMNSPFSTIVMKSGYVFTILIYFIVYFTTLVMSLGFSPLIIF